MPGALANAANDKELSQHDLKQKAMVVCWVRVGCLNVKYRRNQLRSTGSEVKWKKVYISTFCKVFLNAKYKEVSFLSTADLGKRHFGLKSDGLTSVSTVYADTVKGQLMSALCFH